MKPSKIALICYLFISILGLISTIIDNHTLMLLTKPLLIPTLFFYYYFKSSKNSLVLYAFFIFSFTGIAIALLDFDNELFFVLLSYFICNLLVVFLCLKAIEPFRFKLLNAVSIFTVFSFLVYLWFSVVDLFDYLDADSRIRIGIFGLSLFFFTFFAAYNIILKVNTTNLFMLLSAFCLLISNVLYLSYNFQNQLWVLSIIQYSTQMASYYFLVEYFLCKNASNSNG